LGEEVKDNTFFFPSEANNTPGTSSNQMNDYIQGMDVKGMQTYGCDYSHSTEIF